MNGVVREPISDQCSLSTQPENVRKPETHK